MTVAIVFRITSDQGHNGTVYRIHARCTSCGHTVVHGGGSDRAQVANYLGHRASHCRCDGSRNGYHLIDPDGITAPKRPPHPSQPVLWWQLINELEEIRATRGIGLASVWAHVHRSDYAQAREALDGVREFLRMGPRP